jgi:hypothetical protein
VWNSNATPWRDVKQFKRRRGGESTMGKRNISIGVKGMRGRTGSDNK